MADTWIIFDAMGVIFEVGDDTNELLVPYIQQQKKTVSAVAIREEYLKASLGQISSYEFWKNLNLHKTYPEIETEYLDRCLTLDPEFVPVAEK